MNKDREVPDRPGIPTYRVEHRESAPSPAALAAAKELFPYSYSSPRKSQFDHRAEVAAIIERHFSQQGERVKLLESILRDLCDNFKGQDVGEFYNLMRQAKALLTPAAPETGVVG
jgi:hypothetical protein